MTDENKKALPTPDPKQEEMIRKALKHHLLENIDKQNVAKASVGHVVDSAREFMGSFVILGYGYDGAPITFTCANNPQEMDALTMLINKYIQQGS